MYYKYCGLILISLIGFSGCAADDDLSFYLQDLAFEMPEISIPGFPSYSENIVDHGAIGDGRVKNTEAIARAIAVIAKAGGGTVYIPAGIWLTGPIQLQSNINLHVAKGALLQFTSEFEDYPLIRSTWEGRSEVRCISPIYGKDLENIAITGAGVINGAGDAWRPAKKYKLTDLQWKQKLETGVLSDDGKVWWPSDEAKNGRETVNGLNAKGDASLDEYAAAHKYLRPVMVNLVNCKNVLLDGPTFQNSPAWNIHLLLCESGVIRNITVLNPWYSQNGDGLDLESSRNVLVYNSRFDVGDDAICLKSGKNEYGRRLGRPSENIVITDCIVYHGHGGFTIGSEMSGGIRNVVVRRSTFIGTDVGLRFKSTRGRGGIVENIYISDIIMKDIPTEAIRFNMFYDSKPPIPELDSDRLTVYHERPKVAVDEGTPSFRNINIENITCRRAGQAVFLQGLPEMAISNIVLNNIVISAKNGLVCVDADGVSLNNVTILSEKSPVMSFLSSRNVLLEDVFVPGDSRPFMVIDGEKSANIRFRGVADTMIEDLLSIGKRVPADAVILD